MSDVRLLRADDVPGALGLSIAASWNQTAADWERLLRIAPNSCWCVEDQGTVVATTTLVVFGELGWIGMVLTDPAYRSRGLARKLLQTALTHSDVQDLRTLKLDATEFGKPLYKSLGFVTEETVERWHRPGEYRTLDTNSSILPSRFEDLNRASFGVDRSMLLRDLFAHCPAAASSEGFALARGGREALYLGPCFSECAGDAAKLIESVIGRMPSASWYWDLLPSNEAAVRVAKENGFSMSRRLWRMRRGPSCEEDGQKIFAIAGFEFG